MRMRDRSRHAVTRVASCIVIKRRLRRTGRSLALISPSPPLRGRVCSQQRLPLMRVNYSRTHVPRWFFHRSRILHENREIQVEECQVPEGM